MSFAQLAHQVDPAVRQSLLDFRHRYPQRQVYVHETPWTYVALGKGTHSILFLHGMMGASDIWWQQMEALSPHFRVISVTYPPVSSLEAMSQGVLGVLDAEGISKTHVVGSSLGGYLAQYLVAFYPHRIRKAVFGNTFPPNDLYAKENRKLIRILPFLPAWLVMRTMRHHVEKVVYPASGYSSLVRAYLLEQTYGRMSKAQVIARAKAVMDRFAPGHPDTSRIPVMILEADNDPLVPEILRTQLKATYPTAQVKTLHRAGHFPYLNVPETYTELLRAFLADTE